MLLPDAFLIRVVPSTFCQNHHPNSTIPTTPDTRIPPTARTDHPVSTPLSTAAGHSTWKAEDMAPSEIDLFAFTSVLGSDACKYVVHLFPVPHLFARRGSYFYLRPIRRLFHPDPLRLPSVSLARTHSLAWPRRTGWPPARFARTDHGDGLLR